MGSGRRGEGRSLSVEGTLCVLLVVLVAVLKTRCHMSRSRLTAWESRMAGRLSRRHDPSLPHSSPSLVVGTNCLLRLGVSDEGPVLFVVSGDDGHAFAACPVEKLRMWLSPVTASCIRTASSAGISTAPDNGLSPVRPFLFISFVVGSNRAFRLSSGKSGEPVPPLSASELTIGADYTQFCLSRQFITDGSRSPSRRSVH